MKTLGVLLVLVVLALLAGSGYDAYHRWAHPEECPQVGAGCGFP